MEAGRKVAGVHLDGEIPSVVHEDDVVWEADPVAIVDGELEVHSHFELDPLGLGLDGPVIV